MLDSRDALEKFVFDVLESPHGYCAVIVSATACTQGALAGAHPVSFQMRYPSLCCPGRSNTDSHGDALVQRFQETPYEDIFVKTSFRGSFAWRLARQFDPLSATVSDITGFSD